MQIALSRIATEKGAAIDSFYVTDEAGKKLRSNESDRASAEGACAIASQAIAAP